MAHTRPRGFAPWNPNLATVPLLNAINDVLSAYADSLPMTGRQIFYRLVATIGYEKTETAYKRLLEVLNRARRSGRVPMDAIRDDGAVVRGAGRFSDAADFLHAVIRSADGFRLDLLQDQPQHVELFCEASGMVPQLARVAEPYGIAVRSSGGFDSTTAKHEAARSYSCLDKPVLILHVGDHDPSGEHLHESLRQDLQAFSRHYGGCVDLRRIAVTPEQQAAYGLATAPPKPTDRRRFDSAFTVQAEALAPDDLAAIVRSAIDSEIDADLLRQSIERQDSIRADLRQRLSAVAGPQP